VDLFRKVSVSDMMTCLEVAVHVHSANISNLKPQGLAEEATCGVLAAGTCTGSKQRDTARTHCGVNAEKTVAAS
jgi:hypothetical protein